ncbi:MAG: DUF962 domain-containing protein, partial [Myxococcota bacterium]|nr:DUF962 domain-containing protein [Myxococcota bacterium]
CLVGWVGFSGPVQLVHGIVFAYLFAWVGHFIIERNRPATFTYPVWSLWGDMRMWSRMARGQLWGGDTADVVSVPPAVEQPAA